MRFFSFLDVLDCYWFCVLLKDRRDEEYIYEGEWEGKRIGERELASEWMDCI